MDRNELCAQPDRTCAYHSPKGCCNGLIDDAGAVASAGQCVHARVKNVFGTMTADGFTPDACDPSGLGRAALAFLARTEEKLRTAMRQ